MTIYENDYFKLVLEGINVWIHMIAPGFDIKGFSAVGDQIPRLKLTNFGNLTKSLNYELKAPVIIGVYRHKIEVDVSSDALKATAQVLLTQDEYEREKGTVVAELIHAIKEKAIIHGILKEVLSRPLPLLEKFVIAEGIQPVDGDDAIIKYYQLSDQKPKVLLDGKVNHYELNLIDNIHVGEWLGEKSQATQGKQGVNIYGEEVPAKSGRDQMLRYDFKTVSKTVQEDGSEHLYALKDGAVRIIDGKIGVDNHLKISGDVDFNTGNIDFDGYVTITGTVKDGFSVKAQNDITILGELGIGAVTSIQSTKGSIFVKGGVNGKNIAKIIAGNHIYLKYANECTVVAENSINIGFYAMDAQLRAKKVIVNPAQGRVIGGRIEAEHQIVTGTLGNQSERRTEVFVNGFERCSVKDELDALAISHKELISRTNKIKRQLEVFETHIQQLDEKALNTFKGMKISYEHAMDELVRMQNKIEQLTEVLKTRGDGEVQIALSAFPKTVLEIKQHQKRITDTVSGSFYVKDNNMLFEVK